MFKQDWMERQIDSIAKTFSAVLFGKDKLKSVLDDYEQQEQSETDLEEEMIKRVIKNQISQKKYQDAQDMIFKLVQIKNSLENLEIGLSFYNELHDMDGEDLVALGFSEEGIKDSITKLRSFYE